MLQFFEEDEKTSTGRTALTVRTALTFQFTPKVLRNTIYNLTEPFFKSYLIIL